MKSPGDADPVDAEALPEAFFARPTLTVARELLGARLCHRLPGGELRAGRIVEVEAYLGPEDKASHARLQSRRRELVPTPRSAIMFGPVGRAYVYLIYGMHHCVNVVAHAEGAVGAVLIRALAPEAPLPPLSCRGPAKLCAALDIDRRHNGYILHRRDLRALPAGEPAAQRRPGEAQPESSLDSCLWLAPGEPAPEEAVARGPRIGVAYAGEDALLPYRLGLRGHAHLSRPV